MENENEILISAALDGERVDVETLRQVLETGEGQRLLASFLLIRAEIAADGITPSRALCLEEIEAGSVTQAVEIQRKARKHIWRVAGMRIPISVTACLVLAALTASFWLGSAWRARFQPGIGVERSTPAISATVGYDQKRNPAARTVEPPKPTRVLRYVPGSEWRPKS
jgi:hypothetical protein